MVTSGQAGLADVSRDEIATANVPARPPRLPVRRARARDAPRAVRALPPAQAAKPGDSHLALDGPCRLVPATELALVAVLDQMRLSVGLGVHPFAERLRDHDPGVPIGPRRRIVHVEDPAALVETAEQAAGAQERAEIACIAGLPNLDLHSNRLLCRAA